MARLRRFPLVGGTVAFSSPWPLGFAGGDCVVMGVHTCHSLLRSACRWAGAAAAVHRPRRAAAWIYGASAGIAHQRHRGGQLLHENRGSDVDVPWEARSFYRWRPQVGAYLVLVWTVHWHRTPVADH